MLLSCEDGNKQSPSDWKLSLDFHPPPALLKNKNVNKRRQQDGEEHQLGENLRVWERTGRWKGGERLFLSLQTVYITKEESLEHNRAVPRATAQPVLSCCQSVAAAWTLRVFKRPTRLEDYSKARLTCGSAFSKRAPLIKSSLLAVGRINTTTWNRRCSFLLPGGELLEWNARVGAWCGCERGRNWLTNHHPQHKTRSAAHNTLVQKKQKNKKLAGAEIASSQNKLFLCGVQKKKKKEKWFHIEELHNSWEKCGKSGQCWQSLVGLSTLQVTPVNKLQPLFGELKSQINLSAPSVNKLGCWILFFGRDDLPILVRRLYSGCGATE